MFAQISFNLAQKLFASGAILGGLCGVRMDSIEIVTADKQVAGETAAVLERIARGLSKLERFTLAPGHFRCVDNGWSHWLLGLATGRVGVAAGTGFCAGFFSDLFFGRFEWRFHSFAPLNRRYDVTL